MTQILRETIIKPLDVHEYYVYLGFLQFVKLRLRVRALRQKGRLQKLACLNSQLFLSLFPILIRGRVVKIFTNFHYNYVH